MVHKSPLPTTGFVCAHRCTMSTDRLPVNWPKRDSHGEDADSEEFDEVLTTEEAADLLSVTMETILSLAGRGLRSGGSTANTRRFLRSDRIAYVQGDGHQDVALP